MPREPQEKSNFRQGLKIGSAQAQRRAAALRRQKQGRNVLLSAARQIVLGASDGSDSTMATDCLGAESQSATDAVPSPWPCDSLEQLSEEEQARRREARRASQQRARRRFWASQVTAPEWMVDLPDGLNGSLQTTGSSSAPSVLGSAEDGWFVRARPEGRRCIVTAYNGKTTARMLDGKILHRWESALPFGSHRTMQGRSCRGGGAGTFMFQEGASGDSNFVVLDCIFQEATNTHWVMDGMFWKDCALCACTAEFRLYWLYQKLAELPEGAILESPSPMGVTEEKNAAELGLGGIGEGIGEGIEAMDAVEVRGESGVGGLDGIASGTFSQQPELQPSTPTGGGSVKVRLAPYYDCNPQGLEAAYQGPMPFLRDGLLFYLKAGLYEPGSTPLVLAWKDAMSSRYLVYSDTQEVVLAAQEQSPGKCRQSRGCEEEKSSSTGLSCNRAADSSRGLALVTLEGIQVDVLPSLLAAQHDIAPGDLLKFVIDGAEEITEVIGEQEPSENPFAHTGRPSLQSPAASDNPFSAFCLVNGSSYPTTAVPPLAAVEATADPATRLSADTMGAAVASTTTAAAAAAAMTTPTTTRYILHNLRFSRRCSPSRALADSWSKILFQHRARSGVVKPSITQILESVSEEISQPPLAAQSQFEFQVPSSVSFPSAAQKTMPSSEIAASSAGPNDTEMAI